LSLGLYTAVALMTLMKKKFRGHIVLYDAMMPSLHQPYKANTLCRQTEGLFNVKEGGAYTYHCDLKG